MLGLLLRFASVFAVALWVGGGAAISFFVAPVVFERAGSRKLAGEIVGQVLRRFNTYALVAGPIAFAAAFLELGASIGASRTLVLKLALIAAMLGLALYSRFSLLPQIQRLRKQMGDEIDRLPRDDPRRLAFGKLHGFSVLCLMVEIILGAFALAVAVMPASPSP
jgi:hypothetical protein